MTAHACQMLPMRDYFKEVDTAVCGESVCDVSLCCVCDIAAAAAAGV